MRRRHLVRALGAGTAAALAGCTTGGGDATTTASDATLRVESVGDYGDVLVDAEGMSLYVFDDDGPNESACHDDCADNWPPLTESEDVSAGDGVAASLGTIEREDGSSQVTAEQRPLYYYAGDSDPGDASGQGVGDAWWLVAPDGSKITSERATTDDGGAY